jgi:hypothetical protein
METGNTAVVIREYYLIAQAPPNPRAAQLEVPFERKGQDRKNYNDFNVFQLFLSSHLARQAFQHIDIVRYF